jgi:hypothetical protein
VLVDRPETLREIVAELAREPALGLDVEGDGLFRYRARLCTMQIGTPARAVVVDTLALAPEVLRDVLGPLLGAGGPRKVTPRSPHASSARSPRGSRRCCAPGSGSSCPRSSSKPTGASARSTRTR